MNHTVGLSSHVRLMIIICFNASNARCIPIFMYSALDADPCLEALPVLALIILYGSFLSYGHLCRADVLLGAWVLGKHDGVQVTTSLLH